ncbi:MAG TPA: crotonase/enoyl-CoA hydratase family protein [Geminicoccaceae bacterium]|nr:crotonase/enoyl-CoA hydratase family protein [Geminicoccus sp.]HMU49159.1 crotonase/enoyl-CoA hydratase family protein [Geminicoccaceae bacterium]
MAASNKSLHSLLKRGENDNQPLSVRTLNFAGRQPALRRAVSLDIDLPHLSLRLEAESGILWARMRHDVRACYTPELMRDMREIQQLLRDQLAGRDAGEMPFRWLVWASDAPRVWSLGGDLTSFTAMIRSGDEAGLRAYAHLAIDILHDNHINLDLPIQSAALVEGDAIGGGFEAMLTDDLVVAERGAKFGLPEILFNLFPGMGAQSFLERKLGPQMARRLIEDGITRSADEMQALGLVDLVCEPGEGESRLRRHIDETAARFGTMRTLQRVRQRSNPVTKRELVDIVDLWTDLAMELGEPELRRMDALARVQQKKRAGG